MQTVFSHIVQKRFSQVNEDVATDALAFILGSNDAARTGMVKLLRGMLPDLPSLEFRAQQAEGSIRPDLWGFCENQPRVFVENKFWAGLTDNQPVPYLQQLARYPYSTLLLMVAPEAREQTLWRELMRRLGAAQIPMMPCEAPAGVVHVTRTCLGPTLALTSWSKVLSTLEAEVADDTGARSDLLQLRALCEAADDAAYVPMTPAEVTDQRLPALIEQLGMLVQAAINLAVTKSVVSIAGTTPQADWMRIGRYARLSGPQGVGIWFGIHFGLWRKLGGTPLWLVFFTTTFGRAAEVQKLLDPWVAKRGIFASRQNIGYVVAIDIETGEERDRVVQAIVERLGAVAEALSPLYHGLAAKE
jgi:hypothetical protein